MKKSILLLFLPFIFSSTLSAQIWQEHADQIVIEHLSKETNDFTLYAKDSTQTGFEITTSTGEILELNYTNWVYYVNFTDEIGGKYLIVKESNGNVLEVNTKNDWGPDDLEEWRIVVSYPIKIPFTEYSLSETLCLWNNYNYNLFSAPAVIINSEDELHNYISCAEGNYIEIDFSKNTLILAAVITQFRNPVDIGIITFTQSHENIYFFDIELLFYEDVGFYCTDRVTIAIVTEKMNNNSKVHTRRKYTNISTQLKNINFPYDGGLIMINSAEEFEEYFEYKAGNKPDIDFLKHTLLVAHGDRDLLKAVHNHQLIKQGENQYELYLEMVGSSQWLYSAWIVKLLTGKLSSETIISLNVKY